MQPHLHMGKVNSANYEEKQAEMQNPAQDNSENVLNDFDPKKSAMQDVDRQQNNTQNMSGNDTDGQMES